MPSRMVFAAVEMLLMYWERSMLGACLIGPTRPFGQGSMPLPRGSRNLTAAAGRPHGSAAMSTKELRLTGTFTALVTPFTPDGGEVDLGALDALVEAQIEGG